MRRNPQEVDSWRVSKRCRNSSRPCSRRAGEGSRMKQLRTIRIILGPAVPRLLRGGDFCLVRPPYPVTRMRARLECAPLFRSDASREPPWWLAPAHSHFGGIILRDKYCPARTFSDIFIASPAGCPAAPQEVGVHTRPACALPYPAPLTHSAPLPLNGGDACPRAWNMMTDYCRRASPIVAASQWKAAGTRRCHQDDRRNTHDALSLPYSKAMRRQEFCTSRLSARYSCSALLSEYAYIISKIIRLMHVMRTV